VKSELPIHKIYELTYPEVGFTHRFRHYVICSEDRSIQPGWQNIAGGALCGVNKTIIAAGHCPHISQPQLLSTLLLTIGEKARAYT
jgi:hypothetical protein